MFGCGISIGSKVCSSFISGRFVSVMGVFSVWIWSAFVDCGVKVIAIELKNRIATISPVISFWRYIVTGLFGSSSFCSLYLMG